MGAGKWMLGVAAAALMAGQAKADFVISGHATTNVSCSSGTCTATAPNAALNVNDLTNMLAAGDVTVKTGGGANNIVVAAGLSWTSASRLTLDANMSITIVRPVTVAGTGAVTIATNDGSSGGDLVFEQKGKVTFWDTSSSLVINGTSYTLVKDIATLAADIAANPSGFYALASDYDASKDGTYSSAPIRTTFEGIFEGLGHAIDRLAISGSDDWVGLFRQTGGTSGTLRDIALTNIAIDGTSPGGGGSLVGMSNGTTIIGCRATGSIVLNSSETVGGLVGNSNVTPDGLITRSQADVSVTALAAQAVGGLVGQSGFSISLSYGAGHAKGGDGAFVGGLVGVSLIGSRIEKSYATGKVTAGNSANIGGLVGGAGGLVENAYATGAAKSRGRGRVGGFIGFVDGAAVDSSYSTGQVDRKSGGGFLGSNSAGSFSADYWDVDTSGKGRRHGCGNERCDRGIEGLTTVELQASLPIGFDPAVWAERADVNSGFPYLLALPPPE